MNMDSHNSNVPPTRILKEKVENLYKGAVEQSFDKIVVVRT